jgi:hypothetical protein
MKSGGRSSGEPRDAWLGGRFLRPHLGRSTRDDTPIQAAETARRGDRVAPSAVSERFSELLVVKF